MAEPAPACPTSLTLEELALDQTGAHPLNAHLLTCDACRRAVGRIRENNRFLSGFAIEGAFPSRSVAAANVDVQIAGYQIIREIHRGGQGVVYEALQQSTRRSVAIKVMKQGPFATLADRGRFEREIETLGKLNHPNIVAVHDAGAVAGFHYFVMNYIDGATLDEALAGASAAPGQNALILETFIKVCDAVHAAHLRGIIHRDLKPSNIRVDRAGEPHVLDFGLAKAADGQGDSAMTRTGQFVGSLPWASPEQLEGASSKIDLRTDVYSLGAILFQLLTGVLPFDVGSNLRAVFDSILFHEPPRPSTVVSSAGGPRIDDELDTIVLKCLSKDADRRYQTAGELARDLRHYLAGEAIEAKRDSAMYVLRKTLRRYRLSVSVAAAFVVLMGIFGVVMAVLYRHSVRVEQQASHSAASLADLLSQSNIEKGRMAGLLGNLQQAESLLWRELLLTHSGGDQSARLTDPPGPPEALWALWELYRRSPCLRTCPFSTPDLRSAVLADDGVSLWACTRSGQIEKLAQSGRITARHDLSLPPLISLPKLDATGGRLLTVNAAHVQLLETSHGETVREFDACPISENENILLSPDGRVFLGVCNGVVQLWQLSPAPAADVEKESRFAAAVELTAAALSPDGRLLAARDRKGGLHVWDVASHRVLADVSIPVPPHESFHSIGPLLFSPDGTRIADAWLDTPGRIWDVTVSPPTYIELSEPPGNQRVQSFSPDGRLLAIGDLVGKLRVFDVQSGRMLSDFVAHLGQVRGVEFTRDGRNLWTIGASEFRLWEVDADADVRIARVAQEMFHTVDVSPDGKAWLAGGRLGRLHYITDPAAAPRSIEFDNDATISCVAWSPGRHYAAAGVYGVAAFLWNAADLSAAPRRLPHPHRVSYLCFSPDDEYLATACDDAIVRIWRCADGALQREFRVPDARIPQIAFDSRGRSLVAAGRNGALLLWDLDSGAALAFSESARNPLRAVRFSCDDRWLIAGGAERTVDLWDVRTRRRVAAMAGHNQEIYCLDVSPDGRYIASGDSGGAIRLWQVDSRRPLATLEGHSGSVMALRFGPDSQSLVSASLDGTLRSWDLRYYLRHVAGNLAAPLAHLPESAADPVRTAAWRRWVDAQLEPVASTAAP